MKWLIEFVVGCFTTVNRFLKYVLYRASKCLRIGDMSTQKGSKKVITVALIHSDGQNIEKLFSEFSLELRSADVVIARNMEKEDLKRYSKILKRKSFLFLGKERMQHGNLVEFISNFDIGRLRSFEKRGVPIVVTNDKKTAWMISQMFPFYCILPGETFQETVITAPIPITRTSDGYYFLKTVYRNQVTLIDLNVDVLMDFRNPN
ncbi:MAG TPA: hypothetical protein PKI14_02835 [Fervidobacterium sp.]|nr:hypothetical protein [Fervidobacterium sp.]HOQ39289.1 hypothetical protein [Fervidobacterium sp.]HPZ17118.1 hypothetical protein [Fervidobacterium sp.]HQE48191.1 hypothetical protein [Fervidobacterium sp.]HRD20788.1 hypothetical protein [Fervidobacterium sp.]